MWKIASCLTNHHAGLLQAQAQGVRLKLAELEKCMLSYISTSPPFHSGNVGILRIKENNKGREAVISISLSNGFVWVQIHFKTVPLLKNFMYGIVLVNNRYKDMCVV